MSEIDFTPDPVKVSKEVGDFLQKKIKRAGEAKNPELVKRLTELQSSITNRFVQKIL